MIITFGLSIFLGNLSLNIFSADFKSVPYLITSLKLYTIYIPATRLIAFGLSIFLTLILIVFLRKGKWGVALRATAQNVEVTEACGVNVNYIGLITMGIGCALAGSAGSMISITFSTFPSMGLPYAIKSFVVIIMGGMGSIGGAFYGGMLLGMVDTIGSHFLGNILSEMLAYMLMITVLLIKPEGIGGK